MYSKVVYLVIISLLVFIVTVKLTEFIPKKYHGNIHLMRSLGTFLIICGAFITYNKEKNEKQEKQNKEYSESILKSFIDIDTFILNNYKELFPILSIFYSKIQIPSSQDDFKINEILRNISPQVKDTLFLLYNHLTNIFEKMYITNTELFNNANLGIKVRMYIDNALYYEYWSVTKRMYNTSFIVFMENKYRFLTISDFRYEKPDRKFNKIPYLNDLSFIFLSPKYDGKWR